MKIFYDVDTQKDFMNKGGALYVPDAELIKPNLRKLTNYARENFIPGIGEVDRHFGTPEYKKREGELQRWGGPFPDHCMNNTEGQMKINETFLPYYEMQGLPPRDNATYIPHRLDNKVDRPTLAYYFAWTFNAEPVEMTPWEKEHEYRGLFFEKQSYDVFTNPAFPAFLSMANVKQAIVYGVATDYCVKAAVLGMQQRDIQCYVVEDAIKGVEKATTKAALEEMAKAGAKLITTKNILEGKII